MCPFDISNGKFKPAPGCHPIENKTCEYTCAEKHRPKTPNVMHLTCQANGDWTSPLDELCERKCITFCMKKKLSI